MSNEISKIPVKEFMTKAILTVDASTSASAAAKKLESAEVGSVIVTENEKPIGIITERDFAVKMIAYSYPSFTKVTQIMSSPIIHVVPDESVLEVADLMAKKKIRKVPVIDGTEVVGIFTATDLLNIFTMCTEEDLKKMYQRFLTQIYELNVSSL